MAVDPPKRRTILVHFRNRAGVTQTEQRQVFFARGFGHYIKHDRRLFLVDDPDASSLTIGPRAPSAPDPD